METVAGNKQNYTKRQIKGAEKARELYAAVGYPSQRDFRYAVQMKQIADCPITTEDVDVAYAIWGQEYHYPPKAQPVQHKPMPVTSNRPVPDREEPCNSQLPHTQGRKPVHDLEFPGLDPEPTGVDSKDNDDNNYNDDISAGDDAQDNDYKTAAPETQDATAAPETQDAIPRSEGNPRSGGSPGSPRSGGSPGNPRSGGSPRNIRHPIRSRPDPRSGSHTRFKSRNPRSARRCARAHRPGRVKFQPKAAYLPRMTGPKYSVALTQLEDPKRWGKEARDPRAL